MPHIFISYRRDDTGYIARLLADKLTNEFGPDVVFMDIDNIPLGVDFRDHIATAVGRSDALLALIGDDWIGATSSDGTRRLDDPTDFVCLEISSALERGIPVIPVLVGKASMPAEEDLPPKIAIMAFRNAAELRSGRHLPSHLQAIVDELHKLFKETPRLQLKSSLGPPHVDDMAIPVVKTPAAHNIPAPIPRPVETVIDAVAVEQVKWTPPPDPHNPFRRPAGGKPAQEQRFSPRIDTSSTAALTRLPVILLRFCLLLYWPETTLARVFHVLFYLGCFLALVALGIMRLASPNGEFGVWVILFVFSLAPSYILFWLPAQALEWAHRKAQQD